MLKWLQSSDASWIWLDFCFYNSCDRHITLNFNHAQLKVANQISGQLHFVQKINSNNNTYGLLKIWSRHGKRIDLEAMLNVNVIGWRSWQTSDHHIFPRRAAETTSEKDLRRIQSHAVSSAGDITRTPGNRRWCDVTNWRFENYFRANQGWLIQYAFVERSLSLTSSTFYRFTKSTVTTT